MGGLTGWLIVLSYWEENFTRKNIFVTMKITIILRLVCTPDLRLCPRQYYLFFDMASWSGVSPSLSWREGWQPNPSNIFTTPTWPERQIALTYYRFANLYSCILTLIVSPHFFNVKSYLCWRQYAARSADGCSARWGRLPRPQSPPSPPARPRRLQGE